MQDRELVDVAPKNRRYTWSNRRLGIGNIMERLDRFLINVSFLSSFSVGYASILSSSASDHYPITLLWKPTAPLDPSRLNIVPSGILYRLSKKLFGKLGISTLKALLVSYGKPNKEEPSRLSKNGKNLVTRSLRRSKRKSRMT